MFILCHYNVSTYKSSAFLMFFDMAVSFRPENSFYQTKRACLHVSVCVGISNTLAYVCQCDSAYVGLHASVYACVQTVIPSENRWGFFERPPPYLTTNTSRRVNYSTQQASCFWQEGPGSECLLLLGLCLSLDHRAVGQAKTRNVSLISCFPFLIAV